MKKLPMKIKIKRLTKTQLRRLRGGSGQCLGSNPPPANTVCVDGGTNCVNGSKCCATGAAGIVDPGYYPIY